jgi:hypothetical protein
MALQCAADSYSSRPWARLLVFLEASDLDDHALARAERFAALGYVALAWDLRGEGRVVDDLQEAMTQLQPLFDDPTPIRARALRALRILAARPEVDSERIAAIGFCFPISLELVRSGCRDQSGGRLPHPPRHSGARGRSWRDQGPRPGLHRCRRPVYTGKSSGWIRVRNARRRRRLANESLRPYCPRLQQSRGC